MALLKKATMGTAFLKMGIYGFAGSGKTFTASDVAIGLAKKRNLKQIAFFDTEKGSDFMTTICDKNGIELMVHKGRAFVDLIEVMKECEKEGIPLIIDSITHVWRDLVDSYQAKNKKKFMTMMDWNIVKGQWKQFPDYYVNSKVDIIMCGRAGNEYDSSINEDTGKQEMIKSGTKMRAEGETSFESDLLIEMEKVKDEKENIINRAWVTKDRTNTMNGKCIDFPKFKDFVPFINHINFGGTHEGFNENRTSEDAFDNPDWSHQNKMKRKDICLENIQEALLIAGLDGRSADVAKKRTETMIKVFGTSSKTAIESMQVDDLEQGLKSLRLVLGLDKIGDVPPDVNPLEDKID